MEYFHILPALFPLLVHHMNSSCFKVKIVSCNAFLALSFYRSYDSISDTARYKHINIVSRKMTRNPSQDRVKAQRDPCFIKQKFIVFIPTLEVTHIVGKRIFKTFKTKKQEALIRMIIQAIEKCVHLSFARSIARLCHSFARSFAWSCSTGSRFND